MFELGSKIQSQVQSEMEKGQREYFLRQQLKAIQQELGEGDPEQAEVNELRERLEALTLPEDVRKAAERELARLERLPTAAAEYGVIRTYLEWILTLPWGTLHRGQPRPRQRAQGARRTTTSTSRRSRSGSSSTSRSRSCARRSPARSSASSGRPASARPRSASRSRARSGASSCRMSVGGVRDEAEIRGHRRTYIGAMPGTIIRSLRDAESSNPVILIDEIDKMGSD